MGSRSYPPLPPCTRPTRATSTSRVLSRVFEEFYSRSCTRAASSRCGGRSVPDGTGVRAGVDSALTVLPNGVVQSKWPPLPLPPVRGHLCWVDCPAAGPAVGEALATTWIGPPPWDCHTLRTTRHRHPEKIDSPAPGQYSSAKVLRTWCRAHSGTGRPPILPTSSAGRESGFSRLLACLWPGSFWEG